MKSLDINSNIGDTLSSINFNFTCLDIRVCNLKTEATTKWNTINTNTGWSEAATEALAMSANWEEMKSTVYNASAYWDQRVCTIFYPTPFPQGQSSIAVIQNWLNSTFPPKNYRSGQIFAITFFELYKNPALHDPAEGSIVKFGLMTIENNVHITVADMVIFKQVAGKWSYEGKDVTAYHEALIKNCNEACDPCWGDKYYIDHPPCIPVPIYYKLSCQGLTVAEETVSAVCDILNTPIVWSFSTDRRALVDDSVFQQISATSLSPYRLGASYSFNPHLDEVSTGVYQKYIRESAMPVLDDGSFVERISGFSLQHTYTYTASCDCFTNERVFSSLTLDFTASAAAIFPWTYPIKHLRKYLIANDAKRLMTNASSACPFDIQIDSTWYRWATDNLSLSSSPFWHIGTEVGSALGFYHNPQPGVPDEPANWYAAYLALPSLSAYFGTYIDMMGKIQDVKVLA